MITRVQRHLAGLAVVGGLAISAFGCDKVPLLAPSGSAITLTTPVTALPINGSADIVAQVIEPAGTPPQRGTLVSFTTTLGSIQPGQAETDASGIVRVKFQAGTASGTALITAISGGVATSSQTPLRILIGTAAVGSVRVSANPTLLPAIGGTSVITAQALDVNGNPLSAAPVTFSTTAGLIDQSFGTTDQNGLASTTLRTATNATVTATPAASAIRMNQILVRNMRTCRPGYSAEVSLPLGADTLIDSGSFLLVSISSWCAHLPRVHTFRIALPSGTSGIEKLPFSSSVAK